MDVIDHQITNDEKTLISKEKDSVEDKKHCFYRNAAVYWEKVPATVDGILGGFSHISTTDIVGSESFLKSFFRTQNPPSHERALDCGAGIGRVTQHLLQRYFEKVDLVEQCSQFLDKAKETFKSSKKIGEYYCIGLQDFIPVPNTYDFIWCQCVLGHLTDSDLESFFRRLIVSLKPNGVIIAKENITGSEEVELDEKDSSVTRSQSLLLNIIDKANLKVLKNIKQRDFPKSLYEVRMVCMQPKPF